MCVYCCKIKCVNSDNMGNICGKLNFIIHYTQFTTTDIQNINTHISYNL